MAIFVTKYPIKDAEWSISLPAERNKEIEDVIDYTVTDKGLEVKWIAMLSGSYIVHYGDLERAVIVESLF
jgi:hypothetical protein